MKSRSVTLAISILLAALASAHATLPTREMAQVGIVVPDIEKAKQAYAELFGVDVPDTIQAANPADNPTTYQGELSDGS